MHCKGGRVWHASKHATATSLVATSRSCHARIGYRHVLRLAARGVPVARDTHPAPFLVLFNHGQPTHVGICGLTGAPPGALEAAPCASRVCPFDDFANVEAVRFVTVEVKDIRKTSRAPNQRAGGTAERQAEGAAPRCDTLRANVARQAPPQLVPLCVSDDRHLPFRKGNVFTIVTAIVVEERARFVSRSPRLVVILFGRATCGLASTAGLSPRLASWAVVLLARRGWAAVRSGLRLNGAADLLFGLQQPESLEHLVVACNGTFTRQLVLGLPRVIPGRIGFRCLGLLWW